MITRIIVPTDFSSVAGNALKFALKLAEEAGAEVHLLHINTIPIGDAYFIAGSYAKYLDQMESDTKAGFEKLKEDYYKHTSVKFKSASEFGNICDEIRTYAEKNHADLIIMGTTGAGSVAEVFIGSNAASVIADSKIPVLVVPPSATYQLIKDITYATDFNEPEFPSVSRLVYLADLYHAQVTVLHIRSEYDDYFDKAHNFFEKNKQAPSIKNWKMKELSNDYDNETDNVMNSLRGYLDHHKTDLLVMAKHNRTFFDRMFHYSLSKHMAYHVKIPLLVLNK